MISEQVMHDPVDIRRRVDRLVARVDGRDDHGQLLASGQVIHRLEDVEDIEAWRAEISRDARSDKIKVRTGFNDGIVWALRVRGERPERQAEVRRLRELLLRAVPLAVELRHNRLSPFRMATSWSAPAAVAPRSATATPPRTLWEAPCSRTTVRTRSRRRSPP